jgi:FMN phosphatase YigB (HAD superfamily)
LKKLWVFDLDDTLMDNVHDYAEPIAMAALRIIGALGSKAPHISKVIAIEERIDKERVTQINPETGKPFHYSMERFPGSQVETYRHLCKEARVKPDPKVEKELYEIGMTAFDQSRYVKNIKLELFSLVSFLSLSGDKLFIITKGDYRVQKKKINALAKTDLLLFFDGYWIVEDKTPEVFTKVKQEFPEMTSYWSVGNDYDKDIVPSFASGFKGIWIPVETWELYWKEIEEIEARRDKSRSFRFNSLMEIKEKYEELG